MAKGSTLANNPITAKQMETIMENQALKAHVKAIAADLQNGVTHEAGEENEGQMMDGMDYLSDALDINYLVSADLKVMQGARILVAFGGPNIWVDTAKGVVEGYWGSDTATAHFSADPMGVDLAASDLYWAARS
jgi:hypothetical protein